jgi:hypothetical protein
MNHVDAFLNELDCVTSLMYHVDRLFYLERGRTLALWLPASPAMTSNPESLPQHDSIPDFILMSQVLRSCDLAFRLSIQRGLIQDRARGFRKLTPSKRQVPWIQKKSAALTHQYFVTHSSQFFDIQRNSLCFCTPSGASAALQAAARMVFRWAFK